MQGSSLLSISPSFNSYSSSHLAEIAARVVEECGFESDSEEPDFLESKAEEAPISKPEEVVRGDDEDEDEDDDFEFSVVCREPNCSPISADEIFYNGQIRPFYPLFNRDLLLPDDGSVVSHLPNRSSTRLPLRKLMREDQDNASCSSSEADDLEAAEPGTYCVWTPNAKERSPARCKKSNSTGSSKRWKFRDLLHRSNSDGKDVFVFLNPIASSKQKKSMKNEKSLEQSESSRSFDRNAARKTKSKVAAGEDPLSSSTSPRQEHYAKNRALKEGERRRSFLPYRQDLVGFFANVNGVSKNIHPF